MGNDLSQCQLNGATTAHETDQPAYVSPVLAVPVFKVSNTEGPHPAFSTIDKYFKGALEAKEVARRTKRLLTRQYGFKQENVMYGESTCPDEINHMDCSLGSYMQQDWGEVFQMGGIGGCPYVGKFGYQAMLAHAPDNGNVVILFGPHVGISPAGEVGKFSRIGQKKLSTACGAAIAAFNAGLSGDVSDQGDQDIQQSFLKERLGTQAGQIARAENPMAELAHRAYALVEQMMIDIADPPAEFAHFALIGGIQINMPEPLNEYFLPLMFKVSSKDRSGKHSFEDMLPAFNETGTDEQAIYTSLSRHFGGWATNDDIVKYTQAILQIDYGFSARNTLYGQSLCVDEVNHASGELGDQMRRCWGHVFNLGGVGGIPFVGKTGFTAFSHHVPDNGNLFVLYAANIGISPKGELGKILRDGQNKLSTCPASAVAAYKAGLGQSSSQAQDSTPSHDMMKHLERALAGRAHGIEQADNPMHELAMQMFDIADQNMHDIINYEYGSGYLALLGGIQINLSSPLGSVFLPLRFTVARKGQAEVDLMPQLRNQLDIHSTDSPKDPADVLPRREGAFWARQRS
jgi:hypothetical protein